MKRNLKEICREVFLHLALLPNIEIQHDKKRKRSVLILLGKS
jgi:hypothetical protein